MALKQYLLVQVGCLSAICPPIAVPSLAIPIMLQPPDLQLVPPALHQFATPKLRFVPPPAIPLMEPPAAAFMRLVQAARRPFAAQPATPVRPPVMPAMAKVAPLFAPADRPFAVPLPTLVQPPAQVVTAALAQHPVLEPFRFATQPRILVARPVIQTMGQAVQDLVQLQLLFAIH